MNDIVEVIQIDKIIPYECNARTHEKFQLNQIAASIKQYGLICPIVIAEDNVIIAGHGRHEAAKNIGLKYLPVIRVTHLTKNQIRAYRLADNKTAENAGWDNNLLMVELSYLLEIESEFDLDSIGFSTAEVDVIVSDESPDDVDDPPPPTPEPNKVISRPGDIFTCGEHRIGVGDCQDDLFVPQVMHSQLARMSCNDPPYNVPILGHVSGKGQAQHDEFAFASGEMSEAEYIQFLLTVFTALSGICTKNALHYVFMDWRHLYELLHAGREAFDQLINCCVWTKSNGGMGSLYRSQHEMCMIFKNGKAPHTNNVQLGKHGRNRTNVWPYAGMNSFGKDRDDLLASHPTVKPISMIADTIMDVTNHGDIVFDGFLGSGTTLIAAARTHRICYATEIEPKYVDVALRRWMNETGGTPILESTGQSFEEAAVERLADQPQEDSDV